MLRTKRSSKHSRERPRRRERERQNGYSDSQKSPKREKRKRKERQSHAHFNLCVFRKPRYNFNSFQRTGSDGYSSGSVSHFCTRVRKHYPRVPGYGATVDLE